MQYENPRVCRQQDAGEQPQHKKQHEDEWMAGGWAGEHSRVVCDVDKAAYVMARARRGPEVRPTFLHKNPLSKCPSVPLICRNAP